MPRATTLTIPQPCHESWAAMTPTAQGRHCAACQKTVVDFTTLSDAEILALLLQNRGGTCGRFKAGQLDRPLLPLALAPARRWQAWAAALATVLGLRELLATGAKAQQAPTEQTARRAVDTRHHKQAAAEKAVTRISSIQGRVSDASTNEGLPGVTVLIPGSTTGTSSNLDGTFELALPEAYATQESVGLEFHYLGYAAEQRLVPLTAGAQTLRVELQVEFKGGFGVSVIPPAPWKPRSLYYWGKYWVTRPFRR